MSHAIDLPRLTRLNASCVPSGDHATAVSAAFVVVSRRALPPFASTTQTSPFETYAIRVPSGLKSGVRGSLKRVGPTLRGELPSAFISQSRLPPVRSEKK